MVEDIPHQERGSPVPHQRGDQRVVPPGVVHTFWSARYR